MKLLLFSDVHCDLGAASRLVTLSREADVAVCAGDLAVMRQGLREVVEILAAIAIPTVLVPGNGESDEELALACGTGRARACCTAPASRSTGRRSGAWGVRSPRRRSGSGASA